MDLGGRAIPIMVMGLRQDESLGVDVELGWGVSPDVGVDL